jgi:hypothetical protein
MELTEGEGKRERERVCRTAAGGRGPGGVDPMTVMAGQRGPGGGDG